MPSSHWTSRSRLEVHTPIISILLTRKLRCSALLEATHSSLQPVYPASLPQQHPGCHSWKAPDLQRRKEQVKASGALGSVLRQLPRDPVYWQGRRHTRPGRREARETPHICIFKALSCALPSSGLPRGAASCHFHGMSSCLTTLTQPGLSTTAPS